MWLLVIAHPDDESMFFAPSLLQLIRGGNQVSVLCLSTGGTQEGQATLQIAATHASAVQRPSCWPTLLPLPAPAPGNADGLGAQRNKELTDGCGRLGVNGRWMRWHSHASCHCYLPPAVPTINRPSPFRSLLQMSCSWMMQGYRTAWIISGMRNGLRATLMLPSPSYRSSPRR